MKNRIYRFTGAVSRFNGVLSLVLVVLFFASCKGQSGLVNFSPSQTPSQPSAIAPGAIALAGSYADLVSRVSPAGSDNKGAREMAGPPQCPLMAGPSFPPMLS